MEDEGTAIIRFLRELAEEQSVKANRLVVEKWVAGGWGMGRLADGRVVFCPGALPGDVVEYQSLRRRRGVDWAEKPRLLEPGAGRMEPACPHFARCGGCSLLHATPEREAELLEAMAADVLQRQAGLVLPLSLKPLSRAGSRYRGKWQLSGRLGAGYHALESNRLECVQDCLILPECLRLLLPPLQEWVRRLDLEGELYFAADPTGSIVLELLCRRGKGRILAAELARWPGVVGVWFEGCCHGQEAVFPDWRGERPALRPRTFFQSNPASWPLFWQLVEHFQRQCSARTLWDAHAGSGFLSLAWRGGPVHACEPEPHAYANLQALACHRQGWQAYQEQAAATLVRSSFDLASLDAVLLDPPRLGLDEALRAALLQHPPAHLLFFACDVATFARDVKRLLAHFEPFGPLVLLQTNPGGARFEMAAMFRRLPAADKSSKARPLPPGQPGVG